MKTNAARILDGLGIRYELRDYEADPLSLAQTRAVPVRRLLTPPRHLSQPRAHLRPADVPEPSAGLDADAPPRTPEMEQRHVEKPRSHRDRISSLRHSSARFEPSVRTLWFNRMN